MLAGADEQAVELFLRGMIRLTDIPVLIENALADHATVAEPDVAAIQAAAAWAQKHVRQEQAEATPGEGDR